jgi:hypothetical protein
MGEVGTECDVAVRTNMIERLLVIGNPQITADKTWKRCEKLRSENEALVKSPETSNQS